MARALSDYERLRQENIARNESFLKSLGLADIKCQMLPPKNKSRKRQMESESEGESEGESERGSATKKKQRRSRLGVEPSRKSARARGDLALLPDGSRVDPPTYANQPRRPRSGNYDSDLNLDIAADDDATQRKRISAALLRQELDRKPEPDSIPKGRGSKAAKKGKQAGAGVVPVSKAPATSTSTSSGSGSGSSIADVSVSPEVIQLTVTRISSMSNARLATRIKVIARASGSKCKEKLVAFYHALRLSGLTELAESCRSALEQLGHV